jgi:hypothetical protein
MISGKKQRKEGIVDGSLQDGRMHSILPAKHFSRGPSAAEPHSLRGTDRIMLERLFGKKKPKSSVSETAPHQETTQADSLSGNSAPDQSTTGSEQTPAEDTETRMAEESNAGSPPEGPEAAVDLERAIAANARHDTPETRQKLYEELLFSNLLLAVAEAPSEPSQNNDAESNTANNQDGQRAQNGQEIDGHSIKVAILQNPTGMHFAAAFTSGAAAREWRTQGGNFVSVRGRDLYKLLEASPADVIVINPGRSPFVVLPKVDYKQLAIGVVPQNPRSPVHVAPPPAQDNPQGKETQQGTKDVQGGAPEPQQGQVQVAFPPDVFSADQTSFIKTILMVHTQVEAAVFGAIRPPGAKENEWIRTIFIRAINVKQTQEAVQALSNELRGSILDNKGLFKDTPFEVGMMPDPQFWIAMHQNKLPLFDKRPPPLPPPQEAGSSAADQAQRPAAPAGVVDAKLES